MVDCTLPLAFVEKPSFLRFCATMDAFFEPGARPFHVTKIRDKYKERQAALMQLIEQAEYSMIELDGWSSRRMVKFVGVTLCLVMPDGQV